MSPTTTVISDAPWRSPALPTIVAIPGPTVVTVPSGETVAAAGVDELHETGQETGMPLEFLRTAERAIVVPTGPTRRAEIGAISMVFTSTTSTGISIESFSKLAVMAARPALTASFEK